ncbi:MAG: type II secretion system F family protein [Thermoplasmata archaeon]|uniref:Type II secretion system F family protein n=1 Tax=Candidatus Sysuiplasma superficiale TaxID=2823368 RepID=A0A8J7YKX0_9ARCH|nr:type II secretion system F family protein [Candidatus Sysuiplasma superficiale]MBX8643293.1 type II secretion system F family protein [Candidatus Sysuiplasma superficiale]
MFIFLMVGILGASNNTNYFGLSFLDWIVLALAAMTGPYGMYASVQVRKITQIEERIPDFLRDVAEAGRFGMTLAQAILMASSGKYGKLTPEIRRMASQIDWGIPATEAIRMFSERMNSTLITRISNIIIKASDAGGNVSDVLNMVAHDARERILDRKERTIAMSTYMVVIYISFAVFLATIFILEATFIPEIKKAGTQLQNAGGVLTTSGISQVNVLAIGPVTLAFYIAVIVHAAGDGIMAGVIQDGRITNGMRHSALMLLIGFVFMHLLLGV